jgi:hypothetical protein
MPAALGHSGNFDFPLPSDWKEDVIASPRRSILPRFHAPVAVGTFPTRSGSAHEGFHTGRVLRSVVGLSVEFALNLVTS